MLTNEQFDKWISALESGGYEQATHRLRKGDGFCCLGVLADTLGFEWKVNDEGYFCIDFEGIVNTKTISHSVINSGYQTALASMNDNGDTFKDIVKFLKENKFLYVKNSD